MSTRGLRKRGWHHWIGLAFLLIAGILLLFLRTLSDLLLTLLGLLLALMATVGVEGWLGPNGLGLTGPPNSLTALTPVIIIGLTVDYAIQIVSHYREQRLAGEPVVVAARVGLRNVTIPLISGRRHNDREPSCEPVLSHRNCWRLWPSTRDWAWVLSLIVMLTLLPAGRTIIDRRARGAREAVATPARSQPHCPGWSASRRCLAEVSPAGRPRTLLLLYWSAVLGVLATDLESEFSIRDVLPRGGSLLQDMDTLDAAVGGSTELASVLIKAEATETRTLLNLQDLTAAFADEQRRPGAAAGPIQASYALLAEDWTTDSGGFRRQVRSGARRAIPGGIVRRTAGLWPDAGVPRQDGGDGPRRRAGTRQQS